MQRDGIAQTRAFAENRRYVPAVGLAAKGLDVETLDGSRESTTTP
jgi:hypothetical protein